MRRIPSLLGPALLLALSACSAADLISNAIGDCGDLSFDQVQQQNGISDSCRSAIESLLPSPEDSASERLVLLGAGLDDMNRRVFYVQGLSAAGTSLTPADFEGSTVTVTQGGTDTTLAPAEFAVSPVSDETDGIASLSFVTDYSASMGDGDIDAAATIFEDFLDVIPTVIFEAEVSDFSDTVTVRREFSEDADAIRLGIARDDAIERGATALYDGMGAALTGLTARTRPIRVLIVATDGLENASENFSKDEVMSLIADNRILTVMIGTLFSDVSELRDLAGSQGVFFYARSYFDARTRMEAFLESFQNATKITLDAAYQSADSVNLQAQGLSLDADL